MADRLVTLEEATGDFLLCAAYLAERVEGVDAMSEAIKEIVPRFLERRDFDMAAALADVTVDPLTRDRLLSLVAEKCAENGDDEYALQLVEAIEDPSLALSAIERTAIGFIERGEVEKGLRLSSQLIYPDEVFRVAALTRYGQGDLAGALETQRQISMPSVLVSSAIGFARLAIRRDSEAEITNQLGNAERFIADIDLPEESATLMLELSQACIEGGLSDRAKRFLSVLNEKAKELNWPYRDSILSAVASGLFSIGGRELARPTLEDIQDKTVLSRTLAGFAMECHRSGDSEKAMAFLEDAFSILKNEKDSEIKDYRINNAAWKMVAVQFAIFGNTDRCVAVIRSIPDDEAREEAISHSAVALATAGQLEAAGKLLDTLVESSTRVASLAAIAEVIGKNEKSEELDKTLADAIATLKSIELPLGATMAGIELLRVALSLGRQEEVGVIKRNALERCAEILNEANCAVVLARISSLTDSFGLSLTDDERGAISRILK